MTARAFDAAGNAGSTLSREVTVENAVSEPTPEPEPVVLSSLQLSPISVSGGDSSTGVARSR